MPDQEHSPDVQYTRISEYGIPNAAIKTGELAINGAIQFSMHAAEYLRAQVGSNIGRLVTIQRKDQPVSEVLEVDLEPNAASGVLDILRRLGELGGEGSLAEKLYLEFVQAVGKAASNNMAIGWLQDLRHKTGLKLLDFHAHKPIIPEEKNQDQIE